MLSLTEIYKNKSSKSLSKNNSITIFICAHERAKYKLTKMYDAATPSASDLIPKTNLDSPSTLQSVCLDFICENLNVVCITHEQRPQTLTDRSQEDSEEASGESENPVDTPSSSQDVEMQDVADDHGDHDGPVSKSVLTEALTQLHKKLEESLHRSESARTDPKSIPVKFMKFRIPSSEDDDPFFHTELSEELLAKLCSKGLITDLVITLFDAERTRLRTVKIPDASKLSTRGLRVLKGHKIVELEVNSLSKATVTDLIGCLNEWTVANLRSLNVARSTFVDTNKHTIVVALSRLQGLANLNVARTEFNKTSLEMVVEDLPLLESLDISETKVTDISALRKAKSRLKSLSMHGLKLPSSASEATVEVLIELEELRHLDISDTKENPFDVISGGRLKVWDLLAHPEALPKLQSLDLSGKELTDLDLLETYLSHHKDLTFVGLMLSELCRADIFTTANCETTKRNKYVVTGSANENQITEAMRRYLHRPQYIQKSLYYLFRLTQGFAMARPDIIKVIINVLLIAESNTTLVSACYYSRKAVPDGFRDTNGCDGMHVQLIQRRARTETRTSSPPQGDCLYCSRCNGGLPGAPATPEEHSPHGL